MTSVLNVCVRDEHICGSLQAKFCLEWIVEFYRVHVEHGF